MIECPPPVIQECQVIKDGVDIVRFPCTVAYYCKAAQVKFTGPIVSFDSVVKKDVEQSHELLRDLLKTY
jgi:hypothetical protein